MNVSASPFDLKSKNYTAAFAYYNQNEFEAYESLCMLPRKHKGPPISTAPHSRNYTHACS